MEDKFREIDIQFVSICKCEFGTDVSINVKKVFASSTSFDFLIFLFFDLNEYISLNLHQISVSLINLICLWLKILKNQ